MALIDRDEVARLFRGLVDVLATHHPARLRQGFGVAELYQQLLPYRSYRDRLGFTTNQDYEGAVLGLLAGLGGYATVEPAEAQEVLAAEAESPNPDPTLFREFAGARVRLNPVQVDRVLAGNTSYAPPEPAAPQEAGPKETHLEPEAPRAPEPPVSKGVPPEPRGPVFELAPTPPPPPAPEITSRRCPACDEALPGDRPVVFCPFCGESVGSAACARCGDDLAPRWQFCPRCGHRRDLPP